MRYICPICLQQTLEKKYEEYDTYYECEACQYVGREHYGYE